MHIEEFKYIDWVVDSSPKKLYLSQFSLLEFFFIYVHLVNASYLVVPCLVLYNMQGYPRKKMMSSFTHSLYFEERW